MHTSPFCLFSHLGHPPTIEIYPALIRTERYIYVSTLLRAIIVIACSFLSSFQLLCFIFGNNDKVCLLTVTPLGTFFFNFCSCDEKCAGVQLVNGARRVISFMFNMLEIESRSTKCIIKFYYTIYSE